MVRIRNSGFHKCLDIGKGSGQQTRLSKEWQSFLTVYHRTHRAVPRRQCPWQSRHPGGTHGNQSPWAQHLFTAPGHTSSIFCVCLILQETNKGTYWVLTANTLGLWRPTPSPSSFGIYGQVKLIKITSGTKTNHQATPLSSIACFLLSHQLLFQPLL